MPPTEPGMKGVLNKRKAELTFLQSSDVFDLVGPAGLEFHLGKSQNFFLTCWNITSILLGERGQFS